MKNRIDMNDADIGDIFKKYMLVFCEKETVKTYRLKDDAGDGIMRDYEVAKGIEIVYSEIESYVPLVHDYIMYGEHVEIMYMVDGHADFEMENGSIISANKGDICIFNSRIGVVECTIGKGGMRCISVILAIEALEVELNRLFMTDKFDKNTLFKDIMVADANICFPANEMLKNTFMALMQLPEKNCEYHRRLLTMMVIMDLLDIRDGRSADYRYFSADTGNRAHEARKILGENLDLNISVEDLSGMVNLNRTTLQRVFKQMYGVTTFEYRTQVRMQEARNLLLKGKNSVTEIAGICGYANVSKFSAAFKKVFGLSPTEWKAKYS